MVKLSTLAFLLLLLLLTQANAQSGPGGVIYQGPGTVTPGNLLVWGASNQALDGGAPSGGGGVPVTRAINTSGCLSGGGDLSVDRTHIITSSCLTNAYFAAG